MLPVPTAGTLPGFNPATKLCDALPSLGFPKKACRRGVGRVARAFTRLVVPLSSEFSAETKVAFPHPRIREPWDY